MAINVLVVDDSSVMRTMIIKTIRMSRLPIGEIRQASNGKEGLEELQRCWFDLIIADINMPIMNGEAMIDEIQKKPEIKDIPILVISTEGSKARIQRLQNKVSGFIRKPFTPEIIRDTIIDILALGVSNIEE